MVTMRVSFCLLGWCCREEGRRGGGLLSSLLCGDGWSREGVLLGIRFSTFLCLPPTHTPLYWDCGPPPPFPPSPGHATLYPRLPTPPVTGVFISSYLVLRAGIFFTFCATFSASAPPHPLQVTVRPVRSAGPRRASTCRCW
nr:unnamed protein product [Leishmania braziliensis]